MIPAEIVNPTVPHTGFDTGRTALTITGFCNGSVAEGQIFADGLNCSVHATVLVSCGFFVRNNVGVGPKDFVGSNADNGWNDFQVEDVGVFQRVGRGRLRPSWHLEFWITSAMAYRRSRGCKRGYNTRRLCTFACTRRLRYNVSHHLACWNCSRFCSSNDRIDCTNVDIQTKFSNYSKSCAPYHKSDVRYERRCCSRIVIARATVKAVEVFRF
jgi:hypothetical protein